MTAIVFLFFKALIIRSCGDTGNTIVFSYLSCSLFVIEIEKQGLFNETDEWLTTC